MTKLWRHNFICWQIIIEIVVVYYDFYKIHEKFEYSCDVTNKAHPHPSWLVYFVLKTQPFFINIALVASVTSCL